MKKFAAYYEAEERLNERYQADKDDKDIVEEISADYKKLMETIEAEGKSFCQVYTLYKSMRDRGNAYIDVCDLNNEKKAAEMILAFREHGIQFFTFSSSWSSANLVAWEFVKNGCTVSGMMEVNGMHQKFMSDEYEKVPGYLFRTF